MTFPKPADLFDRDAEWTDLESFATDASAGATLALVHGRRRQGKTLLLELLAEATGGFVFTGLEQSSTQNLAELSAAYGAFTASPAPISFGSWDEVVEALLALGRRGPVPVVLDELPYLLKTAPEIPSAIQRSLSPRSAHRRQSRTRLVLCGSSFSIMSQLMSGSAPLRGRFIRQILLHPFDFREAAAFWGVADEPDLAFRLHALVGGTPAYRDLSDGEAPTARGFDAWVVRRLLNPSGSLMREGRILLAEEPEMSDHALYFSVLSAIAEGASRRGQIADRIGRASGALAHPLSVLQEARLIEARDDPLRSKRTTFHIAEPMVRFHQLVVAPYEGRLSRRQGQQLWAEIADTVSAQIYGPHFEELARLWVAQHASVATTGGQVSVVGSSVVPCGEHRGGHQVDLMGVERATGRGRRVAVLGEAKWQRTPLGTTELARLRHIRDVELAADGPSTRLILFSRAGFTTGLQREARKARDVELVDLERLYRGD